MKCAWFVIFLALGRFQLIAAAEITVSPLNAVHLVGDIASLRCTTGSPCQSSLLMFSHRSVDSQSPNTVYTQEFGLFNEYKRHQVVENKSTCMLELVINNISSQDAGTYSCYINEDRKESELIVLDALPECRSNTNLSNVLVENDCNLEPDHIRLDCRVPYRGNLAPVLQWHHSNGSDIIYSNQKHEDSRGSNVATTSLVIQSRFNLNGTNFVCSPRDAGIPSRIIACTTEKISISYFFNSSEPRTITADSEHLMNFTCVVNTSAQCNCKWQASDRRRNNQLFETSGQMISLTKQFFDIYDAVRCHAECRIRDKVCTAHPVIVILLLEQSDKQRVNFILVRLLPIVLLLIVVVIVIAATFLIRKRIRRNNTQMRGNDVPETVELIIVDGNPILRVLREKESVLIRCLDAENGFADCLLSKGVLTEEKYTKLTNKTSYPDYHDQNRAIIEESCSRMNDDPTMGDLFMEALLETDQKHVYNFIKYSAENNSMPNEGAETILPETILSFIDSRAHYLFTSLVVNKRLLDILVKNGCITERHRDRINDKTIPHEVNKELIVVIRKRSNINYLKFVAILNKSEENATAAQLLNHPTGSVLSVHCQLELRLEDEEVTLPDEIQAIERHISELLTNVNVLPLERKLSVTKRLNDCKEDLINLIAAGPGGSIIVSFFCETFNSILVFKKRIETGNLGNILRDIFNCILGKNYKCTRVTVSLDEEEYRTSIQEARETIYMENKSHKQGKECLIRQLPAELLEIFLKKSFIGIMSKEWMVNATKSKDMSGSFNLFQTIFTNCWISAFVNLKSVSFHWWKGRNLKKRELLKSLFLIPSSRNWEVLNQLNCGRAFLNVLENKVITEEERKEIDLFDTVSQQKNKQPVGLPHMQMQKSISKFLECLRKKKYSQMMMFLKLLEDFRSAHILNNIISSERFQEFEDVWPILRSTRNRLISRELNILQNMSVSILLEDINIIEKIGPNIQMPGESRENDDESSISGHEIYNTTEYSNASRARNLIDILYDEQCISLDHKGYIDRLPTEQLKNREILQLIECGSMKSFNIAVRYFKETRQQYVFERFANFKYFSEDIQQIGKFEIENAKTGVVGVIWFEERIYVACFNSKKLYVFLDHKPFDELKENTIEIKQMKIPWDLTASRASRSIFLTDKDSRCLWKIQMPGKHITQWRVDGEPLGIATSPSDDLIVQIKLRGGRYCLDIYRSSDVTRTKSIQLPTEVRSTWHAVQSSNGNFIISYKTKEDVYLISEWSVGEGRFVRTFDPKSVDESIGMRDWDPVHLAIDEDDNVFVSDFTLNKDRVFLFDSTLTDYQIPLSKDGHQIERPTSLWYVSEKKQLLVGQGAQQLWSSKKAFVSVFSLQHSSVSVRKSD